MLFALIGVVAVVDVTAVVIANKTNNVEDDNKLNRPDLIDVHEEE